MLRGMSSTREGSSGADSIGASGASFGAGGEARAGARAGIGAGTVAKAANMSLFLNETI